MAVAAKSVARLRHTPRQRITLVGIGDNLAIGYRVISEQMLFDGIQSRYESDLASDNIPTGMNC
jgi:hypothetical protein